MLSFMFNNSGITSLYFLYAIIDDFYYPLLIKFVYQRDTKLIINYYIYIYMN